MSSIRRLPTRPANLPSPRRQPGGPNASHSKSKKTPTPTKPKTSPQNSPLQTPKDLHPTAILRKVEPNAHSQTEGGQSPQRPAVHRTPHRTRQSQNQTQRPQTRPNRRNHRPALRKRRRLRRTAPIRPGRPKAQRHHPTNPRRALRPTTLGRPTPSENGKSLDPSPLRRPPRRRPQRRQEPQEDPRPLHRPSHLHARNPPRRPQRLPSQKLLPLPSPNRAGLPTRPPRIRAKSP